MQISIQQLSRGVVATAFGIAIAFQAEHVQAAATVKPQKEVLGVPTYELLALRSASPIHFGTINAAGQGFWIGKETRTYCPPQLNRTCPSPTNSSAATIFAGPSQYGTLGLDVVVPGGQQIYIEPSCGKVQFTVAHSAYIPPGSNVTGWKLSEKSPNDLQFLSWSRGTVFCPTGNGTDPVTGVQKGPWQMYAALPNITLPTGCLGASLLAVEIPGPGAWQYV